MTEQEAEIKRVISYIRSCRNAGIDTTITIDKSRNHLILNALEEIQQYREGKLCLIPDTVFGRQCEELDEYKELGTVEELREAMERRAPKKAHKYIAFDGITRNGCPDCFEQNGRNEILYAGQKHCSVCGQAIDWSDTE